MLSLPKRQKLRALYSQRLPVQRRQDCSSASRQPLCWWHSVSSYVIVTIYTASFWIQLCCLSTSSMIHEVSVRLSNSC